MTDLLRLRAGMQVSKKAAPRRSRFGRRARFGEEASKQPQLPPVSNKEALSTLRSAQKTAGTRPYSPPSYEQAEALPIIPGYDKLPHDGKLPSLRATTLTGCPRS